MTEQHQHFDDMKSKYLPRVEQSTSTHKTSRFCSIIAAGISRVDRMTVRTESAQIIIYMYNVDVNKESMIPCLSLLLAYPASVHT